ncbi:GLUG motif-containing protein [Chitinophaga agrisoli]|uniref:GLUG motif-containing protein n=1 Tax=Chitinophaga agrisoli TaxID=2607653 RepID=UPI001661D5D6|nr:GLUG motif-containing protein [Chitinophaga agrisoli]
MVATLNNAPNGVEFSCEITGSNGLKPPVDFNATQSGTTGSDITFLYFKGLHYYKDGKLTLKVTLKDPAKTVIEGSFDKEEFVIREPRDLSALWELQYKTGADPAAVYTQAVDMAFPDDALSQAPVNSFTGTYDGQGHKITNLTITTAKSNSTEFLGLFGSLTKGSVVKNLRLELSATGISSPNDAYLGGIAGYSDGASIINCSVKGNIKSMGGFSQSGGIIGVMENGRITGCSFNGALQAGIAGGIAGSFSAGYMNMCAAIVGFQSNNAGGLMGIFAGTQDTLLNTYAYIQGTAHPAPLFIDPQHTSGGFVISHCFSNMGTPQTGATMYSTITELNGLLADLTVGNLPQGITAPPANKPFKAGADPAKPAGLWWE